MQNIFIKFIKEPLLQFMLIGGCIYLAYVLYGTQNEDLEDRTVVVDSGRIETFISAWESRWNRPPTERELNQIIDQYIREDILYREALGLGLDKDDPITRRRMAQKMEFLTKDIASYKKPEESELLRYFEENIEEYSDPDLITFTHVFFDPDVRGDTTLEDAALLLAELEVAGSPDLSEPHIGDRFMLQNYYPRKEELEIRKLFGSGFSAAVMKLEPGKWHGPVLSGYGTHLVYIHALERASEPVFEKVKEYVAEDWLVDQQEKFNEEFFQNLKSRYKIVIEKAPIKAIPSDLAETDITVETDTEEKPAS
jgi:hypothetical protein